METESTIQRVKREAIDNMLPANELLRFRRVNMRIALWASKIGKWVIQEGIEDWTEGQIADSLSWWKSRGFCTARIKIVPKKGD